MIRPVLLFLILTLMVPATAQTITLGQGDIAYPGETVDMTGIVMWPTYELAWCSENSDCSSPVKYDLSDTNLYAVKLDPNYWRVGDYYRWDGHWNRAENQEAFHIRKGTRPAPTPEPTANITGQTIADVKKIIYTGTHIILARGDTLRYNYTYNQSTGAPAHIWLFRNGAAGMQDPSLMGEPLRYDAWENLYTWDINQSLSETLPVGNYAGYIEYAGYNNQGDIYYNPSHQIEAFHSAVPVLDTIYDDAVIPDVDISGLTSPMVRQQYEQLASSKYLDDTFIPLRLTVYEPAITFNDYYEKDERLYLKGTTTVSQDTILTFKIDPEKHPVINDALKHTWHTAALGTATEMRTFAISLPINWAELSPGNHTIVISAEKNGYYTEISKTFDVGVRTPVPTPIPTEKYISEDYGWHSVTEVPVTTITTLPENFTIVTTIATTATPEINSTPVTVIVDSSGGIPDQGEPESAGTDPAIWFTLMLSASMASALYGPIPLIIVMVI